MKTGSRVQTVTFFDSDVVVLGATPAGIAAAVSAADRGRPVVLIERSAHIGGLVANGLGATDIATRGATGGFFTEFTRRVKAQYVATYGADSTQVRDCGDGMYFEPSVAENVLERIVAERPSIRVLRLREFDSSPENVAKDGARLTMITLINRETGEPETVCGRVFVDATYEGDLAAAAGVTCRVGREDQCEFLEPMAGRIYKQWEGGIGAGSSGLGDNAVQAYNYRLPLTDVAANRVTVEKPADYRREDYTGLITDLAHDRHAGVAGCAHGERYWDGIGRVVNIVPVPNGKTDANNQHKAFVSTDLPEENWPWPTSGWHWRDRFAQRLRDYTLGLLWFCQNDPELPAAFRTSCSAWGLSRDEYADNGHFPRQVYVREGRRIVGEHIFTAHDALPVAVGERPPVHFESITASHYALDSHAVRKREPGAVHLEGFFSLESAPYTVPYRVMVPFNVDGLLVPVAASATHVGFSTLRMEPCWMALGEAAGVAAAIAIENETTVRTVSVTKVQRALLKRGAVLLYFKDLPSGHPAGAPFQQLGLLGKISGWEVRPDAPITREEATGWCEALGLPAPELPALLPSRSEFLAAAWQFADAPPFRETAAMGPA
jgi:hypothetical protein